MQDHKYREEMQSFYNSPQWRRCRRNFIRQHKFICDRCGQTSSKMIVHHKIHLTPMNMWIEDISLNSSNLECLCIQCHNQEHYKTKCRNDYKVDELGKIILD